MRIALLALAVVGIAGLLGGCCGGCLPDVSLPSPCNTCCEPVYESPCCPPPSQGIGLAPATAQPAPAAGSFGGY